MEGLNGASRMAALMDSLRNAPPASFGDVPVALVGDYQKQTIVEDGKESSTGLPRANVLYYRLQNGDVIVVRPSGTEPKIKFYYMLEAKDRADAEKKVKAYQKTLDQLA